MLQSIKRQDILEPRIIANEIRCVKCNRLLFKAKLSNNQTVEIKCSRCGVINIIET